MDFFGLLTMIGGLALFLFGMKTMGDALSKLAGGKLEQVLEKMTNNPIKAVLLGAGVTAVIQSSSATTVMVVGFVNSGIMKLSHAAPVIMGANIGTTITSWILSLAGIDGGNFWIKILKPSSFSPIFALIGVIFIMFVKDEKKNDIGTILIGFAVLMFGMESMSGAVKPLANVPEFTSLFMAFKNPILGMLAGAILTAIIQSSSASVGILQAMCVTGSVSIGAAIPIIMGQNIGTCITALISGIGANKNAKRASLIHLYFNIIGTVLFMLGFYGVNAVLRFSFLNDSATGATVAVIHSVFNIAATIVLLPLVKLIEKLAYLTIPKTENEDTDNEIKVLDERFLERPAFAVAQCKSAVCDMGMLVENAVGLCLKVQDKYDKESIQKIIEIEAEIDEREDELTRYLTKLSAKALTEKDSILVGLYGKCTTYFERMSDYAKGIAYTQRKCHKNGEVFSKAALNEAKIILSATVEIVEKTVYSVVHEDIEIAMKVDPLSDVISSLKDRIRENHNLRLEQGKCSVELGMALTDIVTSLERIAKHCSNIAEEELAGVNDIHTLHRLARSMRVGNEEYNEIKNDYERKYELD